MNIPRCSDCGLTHKQPDACRVWLKAVADSQSHEQISRKWEALASLNRRD